jgi:glycosyltransferase involved in cell wall biosynthesis
MSNHAHDDATRRLLSRALYPLATPYIGNPYTGGYAGLPADRAAVDPPAATGGRPIRAIHVGPCLMRGGAEQWLIDWARALDPAAVQLVRTVVTEPDLIDPEFRDRIPVPVEAGGAEAVARAAAECDVLVSWGVALDGLLGDRRPPVSVFVAHGEGDWTWKLLAGSRRTTDHVVAVSRAVEARVPDGVPSTVIYNGVDTARLARSRPRDVVRAGLGFRPDDFVLTYVGRFAGEKRPHAVIDAVALLPDRFKALLVGWGLLQGDLMHRANATIPGRYAFTAARDYFGDVYHAADALVLASAEEGCALVMLEAMFCGRPVIATPVGSAPELIENRVNGLVVSGDAASVAAAARLLADRPAWAAAVGREGQAYADQHGHASRMAREYEVLFRRLWSESPAGRAEAA